jgi:hypothetical protein
VDGRDKPGHDGKNYASVIVLAMRPASEFCGKGHGKEHEMSAFGAFADQSRRWSPAFASRSLLPKGKKEAERRQTRSPRPALRRGRAPSGALVCRRSTTALAAATERHRSTPATRFLRRYYVGAGVTRSRPSCSAASFSQTGHRAGRACLPKPPGSAADEAAPAGTVPAPPAVSPADVLYASGMLAPVLDRGGVVKRFVSRAQLCR